MLDFSSENKKIISMTIKAFSKEPNYMTYWDENNKSHINILEFTDDDADDVCYSTIGLSDYANGNPYNDSDTRVEVVGISLKINDKFPNILSTIAFCMINSDWDCYPGAIFPDVVKMYGHSNTMKHILFTPPFLWEDVLKTLEFKDKTVAWLLAVPISEAEYKYAETYGTNKLEELLEFNQVDISDINRLSAI